MLAFSIPSEVTSKTKHSSCATLGPSFSWQRAMQPSMPSCTSLTGTPCCLNSAMTLYIAAAMSPPDTSHLPWRLVAALAAPTPCDEVIALATSPSQRSNARYPLISACVLISSRQAAKISSSSFSSSVSLSAKGRIGSPLLLAPVSAAGSGLSLNSLVTLAGWCNSGDSSCKRLFRLHSGEYLIVDAWLA